jgi:hypothetical protein
MPSTPRRNISGSKLGVLRYVPRGYERSKSGLDARGRLLATSSGRWTRHRLGGAQPGSPIREASSNHNGNSGIVAVFLTAAGLIANAQQKPHDGNDRLRAVFLFIATPPQYYWHALYTRACQPRRASGFIESTSAQSPRSIGLSYVLLPRSATLGGRPSL